MSDVRFETLPDEIAKALEEVKSAMIMQNHIFDALQLKQQELMRIAVDDLKLPPPINNEKRSVRFDLESKKIIIEDKAQIIT